MEVSFQSLSRGPAHEVNPAHEVRKQAQANSGEPQSRGQNHSTKEQHKRETIRKRNPYRTIGGEPLENASMKTGLSRVQRQPTDPRAARDTHSRFPGEKVSLLQFCKEELKLGNTGASKKGSKFVSITTTQGRRTPRRVAQDVQIGRLRLEKPKFYITGLLTTQANMWLHPKIVLQLREADAWRFLPKGAAVLQGRLPIRGSNQHRHLQVVLINAINRQSQYNRHYYRQNASLLMVLL